MTSGRVDGYLFVSPRGQGMTSEKDSTPPTAWLTRLVGGWTVPRFAFDTGPVPSLSRG